MLLSEFVYQELVLSIEGQEYYTNKLARVRNKVQDLLHVLDEDSSKISYEEDEGRCFSSNSEYVVGQKPTLPNLDLERADPRI